jgi:hypothetical protein
MLALLAAGPAPAQDVSTGIVPEKVTPLFDGSDLSGWEADVPARDKDPRLPDSFVVRNGMLVSMGKPEGHLVTKQAYRDYRLQVEYRWDARRILNLTDGSEKPLGQWNTMVVEARGRSITVWVNGDKVNEGFDCTADRGKIALQAEGTEVEFRKVEIGPLPAATK